MSSGTMVAVHGSGMFGREMNAPGSKYYNKGKFGRLFPTLPPYRLPSGVDDKAALDKLSELMREASKKPKQENPSIPAGWVFFGQFVDHDITFDPTSSLERQNDPESIQNFRTPAIELDNVYGSGPGASPHLYDGFTSKLLVEKLDPSSDRDDLPRNSQNTALIGDPRNDENLVVSQLHVAFLKFHNVCVQDLLDKQPSLANSPEELFERAQQQVRWHYQWIVLHQFLPLIVGQKMVGEIYQGPGKPTGRKYYNWRHEPFIPVEFGAAVYRYGHAQIPNRMQVNDEFRVGADVRIPVFAKDQTGKPDPDDLRGGVRAKRRSVQWRHFFDGLMGESIVPQASMRIEARLAESLFDIQVLPPTDPIRQLPLRNLLRGLSFGLPSGQSIARAMCVEPLAPDDLMDTEELDPLFRFSEATPLWFYILREAQVQQDGLRLGEVGGRIVAEVIIGLLEGDRNSFVRAYPKWKPDMGPTPGDFTIQDLLVKAGSAI